MPTPTTTSCSGVWAVSSTWIVIGSNVRQHGLRPAPWPSSSVDVRRSGPRRSPTARPARPRCDGRRGSSPWYAEITSAAGPIIRRSPLSIQAASSQSWTDLAEAVADEHDRAAVAPELVDLLRAAPLEALVADGEHLVDEQDLRLDVGGDGEAEPHEHARRVVLDRRVDELLEPGELDDVVEAGGDLLLRQPEDGAVEEDVLAAAELGMEAGAELEQGRDPTA